MGEIKKAQANSAAKILIGTASWSDPGFVEHWYPKKMRAADRLAWYAQHFELVEVNSTFYSVPQPGMVERWCRTTPDGFVFDVKLHQLLSRHSTNVKLLPPALQRRAKTDAKGKVELTSALETAMIKEFLGPIEMLRAFGKLGVLLLQLSPAFSPRKNKLTELDDLLGAFSGYRMAIELRNRNWAEGGELEQTLDFLQRRSTALVSVDVPAQKHFMIMPADLDGITDPTLAYLRLHGRDARAYTTGKTVAARFNYNYTDEEIAEVAERSRKLSRAASEVHVVFNNNAQDFAPHAALRLRKALGQVIAPISRQGGLL